MQILIILLALSLSATASPLSPFVSNANSAQTPLHHEPIETQRTTLVDLLSGSTNHTLLLRAFQKARLIPLLNRLNGSTLFAPTNDAFQRSEEIWAYALSDSESQDANEFGGKHDNLQLELRDTLLYHVLNFTLFLPPPSEPSDSTALSEIPSSRPRLLETLYTPSHSSFNKSFPAPPSLPGSPPDDSDPDNPTDHKKPWSYLGNGEGQKVRIIKKDDSIYLGGDSKGEGGIWLGDVLHCSTGALVSMNRILEKPKDLSWQIRNNPALSKMANLMPEDLIDYLTTAEHLTIFAPTNDAWDSISPLEMKYLQSGFAENDLIQIFGQASLANLTGNENSKETPFVGYMERLNGASVSNIWGVPLVVECRDQCVINGTQIETSDILASNGVLHTLPSLLLPPGTLKMTAEKYLLAANATKFISLLRSVNMSHYVQIPSSEPLPFSSPPNTLESLSEDNESYTILAPPDSVFELFGWTSFPLIDNLSLDSSETPDGGYHAYSKTFPPPGSLALKRHLEYHIIPGKWSADDLDDGMLLKTQLRGAALKDARQRLPVGVHREEEQGISKKKKKGVISFGGASILSDPVVVGKSIVYLISSVLEPPGRLMATTVTDLRLSTFVASVYAANLDKQLDVEPATTYFIPSNDAFSALGLVMSYLLLPSSKNELTSMLKYHAIREIAYLNQFGTSGTYPTLAGSEIYVSRSSNNTLSIHGPTIGGKSVNGHTRDGVVIEGDLLIESGVVHIVDQVELGPEIDISLRKLMMGAKANTMLDLINAANMSFVLDNSSAESEDAVEGALGYTILAPTDKALSRLNLTRYFEDPAALRQLVQLHIIPIPSTFSSPTNGFPLALKDESSYPSLLDRSVGGISDYGSIAFRKWGSSGWLVGIKNAHGTSGESDSARILSYGRATPSLRSGSFSRLDGELFHRGGVFTIDNVLIPYSPGWFIRYGWIGLVSILAVGVVGGGVYIGVKRYRTRRDYELLEGEDD